MKGWFVAVIPRSGNELYHHGIKGMSWGKRRFQNEDGSLTLAGMRRYGIGDGGTGGGGGSALQKSGAGRTTSVARTTSATSGSGRALLTKVPASTTKSSLSSTSSGNVLGLGKKNKIDIGFGDRGNTLNNIGSNNGSLLTKTNTRSFNYKTGQDTINDNGRSGNTSGLTFTFPGYEAMKKAANEGKDKTNDILNGAINVKAVAAKNIQANQADKSDKSFFEKIGDAAAGAGKAVGEAATNAGKAVGNAATDAWNWTSKTAAPAVGKAVTDAANAVGDAATNSANWVGDRAKDVGNALSNQDEKKAYEEAANNLYLTAKNGGNPYEAMRRMEEAKNAYENNPITVAGRVTNDAAKAVGEAATNAGKAVGNAATDAWNWTSKTAAPAVGKAVTDAANAVGDAATNSFNWVTGNQAKDNLDYIRQLEAQGYSVGPDYLANAQRQYNQTLPGWTTNVAAPAVGQAATNVGNAIGEAATNTVNWAGQNIGAPIANAATNVGNAVGGAATDVWNWTTGASNKSQLEKIKALEDVGLPIDSEYVRQVRSQSLPGIVTNVGNAIGEAATNTANWAGQNIGAPIANAATNSFNWVTGNQAKDNLDYIRQLEAQGYSVGPDYLANAQRQYNQTLPGWTTNVAAPAVGQAATNVGNAIGDAATNSWNWAGQNIGVPVANAATTAWNWAGNTAGNVGNWATGGQAAENYRILQNMINNGATVDPVEMEKARNAYYNTLPGAVSNTVNWAGQNIGVPIANAATDSWNWTTQTAAPAVGKAATDSWNWTTNVAAPAVGKAVTDSANWVGDRARDAGNAVGGWTSNAAKDVTNWGAGAVDNGKKFMKRIFGSK